MKCAPISPILAGVILIIAALPTTPTLAGKAEVINAAAKRLPNGTFAFIATIKHADEDFEHFANRIEIIAPDGTILATRPLNHPHVDEQPFTRALPGVKVPENIKEVTVRANDKRHGVGGAKFKLQLPGR